MKVSYEIENVLQMGKILCIIITTVTAAFVLNIL